jgi:hypothetical protein
MDTSNFAGEIIGGLEDVCHPKKKKLHQRKSTLDFSKAPIHNSGTVMGQLEQSGFKRRGHRPDSRDSAPCNFFLFGSMKQQLKGRVFGEGRAFYQRFLSF